MKAITWHGKGDMRCETVPDPIIEDSHDAIIKVSSCAICGSDLHLMNGVIPSMERGDIVGHECMGEVVEVGRDSKALKVGDRVVVPFTISCGDCWMCARGLFSQCEATQVREYDKGAQLFGYTSLYGAVPGGQAEFVRVPHANFGPIKVPDELPDERFLFLSDILPTAWQGVAYANVEPGSTVAIIGLGPVGQLAVRCAQEQGAGRVIGVDLVPERLDRARRLGAEVVDFNATDDVAQVLKEMTKGRGPDSVVDAVGMEAHGNPISKRLIAMASRLPKPIGQPAIEKVGIDRLDALHTAIDAVRRGGTVSLSGVYGGAIDPMPMMTMFDKGIIMRMGQCNVKHWTGDLLARLVDSDPFGVDDLTTHHLPLEQAPEAYKMFQEKSDGCIKVVLKP